MTASFSSIVPLLSLDLQSNVLCQLLQYIWIPRHTFIISPEVRLTINCYFRRLKSEASVVAAFLLQLKQKYRIAYEILFGSNIRFVNIIRKNPDKTCNGTTALRNTTWKRITFSLFMLADVNVSPCLASPWASDMCKGVLSNFKRIVYCFVTLDYWGWSLVINSPSTVYLTNYLYWYSIQFQMYCILLCNIELLRTKSCNKRTCSHLTLPYQLFVSAFKQIWIALHIVW